MNNQNVNIRHSLVVEETILDTIYQASVRICSICSIQNNPCYPYSTCGTA